MVSPTVALVYMAVFRCIYWIIDNIPMYPELTPKKRVRQYARNVIEIGINMIFISAVITIIDYAVQLVFNSVLQRYELHVALDDLNYEDIEEEIVESTEYSQYCEKRKRYKKQLLVNIKMQRERSMLRPVELAIISHVNFIKRFHEHRKTFQEVTDILKAVDAITLSIEGVSPIGLSSKDKKSKIRRGKQILTFADLRTSPNFPEVLSGGPKTTKKQSNEDMSNSERNHESHDDVTPETLLNSKNNRTIVGNRPEMRQQFYLCSVIIKIYRYIQMRYFDAASTTESKSVHPEMIVTTHLVESQSEKGTNHEEECSVRRELLNSPTSLQQKLESTKVPNSSVKEQENHTVAELTAEDSMRSGTANTPQSHEPHDHSVDKLKVVHANFESIVGGSVGELEDITLLNHPELSENMTLGENIAPKTLLTPQMSLNSGTEEDKVGPVRTSQTDITSGKSLELKLSSEKIARALDDAVRAYELLRSKPSINKPKITKTFGLMDVNKKGKKKKKNFNPTPHEEVQVFENFTTAFLATPSNVNDDIYQFETEWKAEPTEDDYNLILDAILVDLTQYG